MLFGAVGSTSAYLCLFSAVLSLGWAVSVPRNSETTELVRYRRMSPGPGSTSCLVPPQPMNGRWKLHRQSCDGDEDCDIPQGIMVQSGTQLVYKCDGLYNIEGSSEIFCKFGGTWTDLPSCIANKCPSLSSVSRRMTAEFTNEEVFDSAEFAKAVFLSCRDGYKKADTEINYGAMFQCWWHSRWDPKPFECRQVCGVTKISSSPLKELTGVVNEYPPLRSKDSPWHASLYVLDGDRKKFKCGATIIEPQIVITIALCVYDHQTKIVIDTDKLFVMTGNTYIDYDSPMHDPEIVKTATVKRVHTSLGRNESGHEAYTHYIVILELQEPFILSGTLLPACFDRIAHETRELEPGNYGTVVGLEKGSSIESGGRLQNLTLPYLPSPNHDTFNTASTNGSGICGSGIVSNRNGLWYLTGIQTSGPKEFDENGDRVCNTFANAVFLRRSWYTLYIILHLRNVEYYNKNETSMGSTKTSQSPTPDTNSLGNDNSSSTEDTFCLVPPQPENGERRIYGYRCENKSGCNIPQGTRLRPGSQLIYTCASGYRASGNGKAFCGLDGNWADIPECIEVKCDPLKSVSTSASCSRFGKEVSCDFPVSPGTRAQISCSKGYKRDRNFVPNQRETLSCTRNGKWMPDPIRCTPVCGVAITHQTPFAIGATPADVGDFPWHATLYRQRNSATGLKKEFKCGATIIHTNFLMTAAHCVYDEQSRKTVDPTELFVTTGNIFRDYDSPAHDLRVVRKGEVKNVRLHGNYYGLQGNYASDIALLELQQPFEISDILLPACLDVDGNDDRILEHGAYGRVAGFGRTDTSPSSGILQTIRLPYVSYTQCKNSSKAEENQYLISEDKFCAGYTNGSAVCEGDSGGGLVFQENKLWYVLGIVSVGLGVDFNNAEKTCDRYSYTLYTRVSAHLSWIQDEILSSRQ